MVLPRFRFRDLDSPILCGSCVGAYYYYYYFDYIHILYMTLFVVMMVHDHPSRPAPLGHKTAESICVERIGMISGHTRREPYLSLHVRSIARAHFVL